MIDKQKLTEAFRLFQETEDQILRAAFIDAAVEAYCGWGGADNYLAVNADDDDWELQRGSEFFTELTGNEYRSSC